MLSLNCFGCTHFEVEMMLCWNCLFNYVIRSKMLLVLLCFSWLPCNILCFLSLDFWKHHKKYDKTNSFVAIYDKSWHACCVVNDTKLQNNLCRFVEGMAPVFSRSAWYCTWHLIQVILLPWFLGILNVSSNYMLKNPFKLFQILCFFQLYYCGTYCGQLQFFVQSFIIVFFSRVSFSSYQKCWKNTNRFSEMRFAFVWLLKTNFSDSLDSLAFCFGRLPEFLVKFDLVFMKFLEIIFLYIK